MIMKSYKKIINMGMVLLLPVLVVACSDGGTQSQTNMNSADPVVTTSSKPTVALSSEQVNAVVGDVFSVDIAMSNFPTSEGGGVTVKFDASMLNVTDVTINKGSWNFVNKVGSIDNSTGVISDILFSSYQGVTGDSQIATITFSAVASGSSQVTLEGSSINPFSSNGAVITVNYTAADILITALSTK